MTLNLIARLSLTTMACFAPSLGLQAQQPGVTQLAGQVCASCHGPRGVSVSPAFPQLAGQGKEYLEVQLKAFRDRTRGDPMAQAYMWGMASQLSDDTIAKLATYYSRQKPARGKVGDPKIVQAGRTIFEQGLPGANVPACLTCHGKESEGNGMFPRLANQHAEYLLKQLVMFKSELRAGANAPIMHTVSTGMTFDQMVAVATYLRSR